MKELLDQFVKERIYLKGVTKLSLPNFATVLKEGNWTICIDSQVRL